MNTIFLDGEAASSTGGGMTIMLVYLLVIGVAFYFLLIRPQKKEQKRMQALIDSISIGDSILTTAGFYGVIIDILDEVVIVEFGNNKNCRIPMKKSSIVEVEKKDQASN